MLFVVVSMQLVPTEYRNQFWCLVCVWSPNSFDCSLWSMGLPNSAVL